MSSSFSVGITLAALIIATTAGQTGPEQLSLNYFQEHFIIREGAFNEAAPLKLPATELKLNTNFRKNQTFAVWDERGLTIRVGDRVKSTKLPDVPLSPKVFARDEILKTSRLIKERKRTREVAGLSGAVRVRNFVYFLARWEEQGGKPWAEALMQVNLDERFPAPKLLGRLRALSMASKPIDDELFILNGKISMVAQRPDHWGLAQYDVSTGQFHFDELGDHLQSYGRLEPRTGFFVERSRYATTIAGRVDFQTMTRKVFVETRSSVRFADDQEPPCLIVSQGDSAVIHNAFTGAELDLPVPSAVRRTSKGLVVWSPISAPKRAWLLDLERWEVKAWWPREATVDRP